MTTKTIFFSAALEKTAEILSKFSLPKNASDPLIIRDISGRISIALNIVRSENEGVLSELGDEVAALDGFAGLPGVLCADDFFDPSVIFQDPSIVQFSVPGTELSVRLLERQVTGQDWLLNLKEDKQSTTGYAIPHWVFFGLKGGVGRSTALALLAYQLAKANKRVLLIDLDLESPGLSSLLLPPERMADFGIVDWLVEDTVGHGSEVCERMISASPLSESTRGEIRIAAAMGNGDLYYLDKLSRAYADVSESAHLIRFSQRIQRLTEILKAREKPDVVLIDSRAGLHDLAALSIVGLASTAFLFATDTASGWQGYRSLFTHWQCRPEVARNVRERLKIVSALFPESDQVTRAKGFLERSYTLFAETLYDEVTPGASGLEGSTDLFNFDIDDSAAPHYPLRIKWNSRFQEFDPLQISSGIFSEDEIRAAYGEFLDGAMQLIEEV